LLHQHLQLVKLGVAGCKVARQWRLVQKLDWIRVNQGIYRQSSPPVACADAPIRAQRCQLSWKPLPACAGIRHAPP
jgi:hypothetical protein